MNCKDKKKPKNPELTYCSNVYQKAFWQAWFWKDNPRIACVCLCLGVGRLLK